MAAEPHERPTGAFRPNKHVPFPRAPRRETFFVGRRPFEAPEVYVVAATGVERLRSEHRFGTPELDWFAPSSATMELAHALLRRLGGRTPSTRLTAQFAVDVVSQLDDDGFVLSSAQILGWVCQFSEPQDWTRAHAPSRVSLIAHAWRGLRGATPVDDGAGRTP